VLSPPRHTESTTSTSPVASQSAYRSRRRRERISSKTTSSRTTATTVAAIEIRAASCVLGRHDVRRNESMKIARSTLIM
jgi:hypothetical protein